MTSTVAFTMCIYVEDCDGAPVIAQCPDELVAADEVAGMSGCCGPIGGAGDNDIPDVTPCATPSRIYLTISSAAYCADYDLEFEL
jgi:hypothetical protein